MTAKNLFILVHTESLHHIERRVGGWYDTDLTPKGHADASIAASRLASLTGEGEIELFSSDLRRAHQTAEAVSAQLGITIRSMRGLREMHYGEAEGHSQDWLRGRQVPPPPENRLDHRGGFKHAETRREFATRIYCALDTIVARPCATQILVTHGFALTFVVAAWVKMPVETTGFIDLHVRPGSITHLREDPFWGSRSVVSLGDASHFHGDGD